MDAALAGPETPTNRLPSKYPPVTLPDTEVRLLKSSIVDDTYRLHVSLPITYANGEGFYPVVYLTDGNGLFPIDPSFQFVTNVKVLAERLQKRRYPGLQLTTRVLEGETHFSAIPAAFSRGLRVVFPISVWERGRDGV